MPGKTANRPSPRERLLAAADKLFYAEGARMDRNPAAAAARAAAAALLDAAIRPR